jgi:hypothetical protein
VEQSADGTLLATSSLDKIVNIYRRKSKQEQWEFVESLKTHGGCVIIFVLTNNATFSAIFQNAVFRIRFVVESWLPALSTPRFICFKKTPQRKAIAGKDAPFFTAIIQPSQISNSVRIIFRTCSW